MTDSHQPSGPASTSLPAAEVAAELAAIGLAVLQAAHDDPGRTELLDGAVTHLAAAVAATPEQDAHLPSRQSNLAAASFARFRRDRSLVDAQEAKRHLQAALSATPPTSPDQVPFLVNLAAACTGCAEYTHSVEDLTDATETLRRLLEVLPSGDPRRLRSKTTLGVTLRQLHAAGGDHQHLDQAIEVLRRAVTDAVVPTTSGGPTSAHSQRPVCLANLGNALLMRGRPSDLALARDCFTEALQLAGLAHPGRAALTASLGATFAALARVHPQTDDLDRAVTALTEAVDLAPAGDPHYPAYLANLADALRTRFQRTWNPADLDRAVAASRRSLAEHLTQSLALPQVSPLRGTLLAILGGVLRTAAEVGHGGATFHESIQVLDQALCATPARSMQRPHRLIHLANALRSRAALCPAAQAAASRADLERAERLLDEAIAAAGSGSGSHVPGRALTNLSAVHTGLAALTGDPDRFHRAVSTARAALGHLDGLVSARRNSDEGDGDGDRPGRLVNLAVALHGLHRQTGDRAALDEAVQAAGEAADAAIAGMPGTAALRADALTDLSIILSSRYLSEDRDDDLNAAVDTARAAVDLTAEAASQLPARRANLGNALRLRGLRLRRSTDLDDAVATLRLAAQRPGLAAEAAGHLSNLGAALQSRAEALRTDDGLDEAVSVLGRAVDLVGPGPGLPTYLSNLGNALLLRARYRQDVPGVTEAVEVQERASQAAPPGHPDRSVILANRANALAARYATTGSSADLVTALEAIALTSHDPGARLQDRIVASWQLADLTIKAVGAPEAPDVAAGLPAMLEAVTLAQEVAWTGLAPADRTTALIRLANLPMDAAATAIAAHDITTAIAAVEAGRAVGWARDLQRRRLDTLDVRHPELAERLRAVGVALNR
jgi:tetratricopeptide (TPR) repeat protein